MPGQSDARFCDSAAAEGEEAECAAAGASFCAVATSRRHLRLFSPAGIQTHLLVLPGAPVALAASGHSLAAVWHGGPPTAGGDQCLQYALYDVAEQRQLHAGPLPLCPGASLAWLGFTEEGQLASYDSHGELRLRSADFGGAWVAAFSAAAGMPPAAAFRGLAAGLLLRTSFTILCVPLSPQPYHTPSSLALACGLTSSTASIVLPCIPRPERRPPSIPPPLPLLPERKSTEQYWLVGLSAQELRCIVCANSSEPAVPSGKELVFVCLGREK